MSAPEENPPYIPITTNYLDVPQDEKLQVSYKAFKVSKETQGLLSEQNRDVFAEAFYEGDMRSLMKICMLALAKFFGTSKLPPEIREDPMMMRIFYDALSVDLPLSKIYCVMDEAYWKRLVLKQRGNQTLVFQTDMKWRNRGLSEKFVKELEVLSAEYSLDEKLLDLADKIKDYVTEIHIKHLQSLKEVSFEKYFKKEENSDTSSASEEESVAAEEEEQEFQNSETDMESVQDVNSVHDLKPIKSVKSLYSVSMTFHPSVFNIEEDSSYSVEEIVSDTQVNIANIETEIEHAKIAADRLNKENKNKALEKRRLRREHRQAKIEEERRRHSLEIANAEQAVKKKRKKKKKEYTSVFDIPLSDTEDDIASFDKTIDQRNPEEYLKRKKLYDYPPEHCHHINLSFLNIFGNLETLSIEFGGPRAERDFDKRHLNFSYQDIKNLCAGITSLNKLRTFKLRNSKMDAKKFEILLATLQHMDSIEILDFGNDNLDDDCALTIYTYFKNVQGILSLELEGNIFKSDFLNKLAFGLHQYNARKLQYLGLARTKLTHRGMHELTKVLAKSNHVQHLNLLAAWLDDQIISCCIAQNLIRNNKTIENINLMAVTIKHQQSLDLLTALGTNQNILELNIRGCDFDEEIEFEIEVLLKRNRHLKDNPHIGHYELLEANEIPRVPNRLYTQAVEKLKKQTECLQNRPAEVMPCAKTLFYGKTDEVEDDQSTEKMSDYSSDSFRSFSRKLTEPFVYDPNTFDEEQFYKHVKLPGPDERMNYFRRLKQPDVDLYSYP